MADNEPDTLSVQVGTEPSVVCIGPADGKHMIAAVHADGVLTYARADDIDPERQWPVTAWGLQEAEWKEHPGEARCTYTLMDGKTPVGTYSFPSSNSNASPEEEAHFDEQWKKVCAFAQEHGLEESWKNLDSLVCQDALDARLARRIVPAGRFLREIPMPEPAPLHEMASSL